MKIKTYKIIIGALALILAFTLIFSIFYIYRSQIKMQESVSSLVVENERLRSFNVRRERRLKWMHEPKEIDLNNVSLAFNILGTKPTVVASLIYCENGPEFLSTGSLDKSRYFAENFPIEQWSALEGARTLNRMAWNWILEDTKRAKSFFLYAAKPYTSLSIAEQKAWADNMFAAERRFRSDIGDIEGSKPENNLNMAIRTPIPTIGSPVKKKNKSRTIFIK